MLFFLYPQLNRFSERLLKENIPAGRYISRFEDWETAFGCLLDLPYYLRQWNQKLSVEENIKQHILSKGCMLYSEVEFLLHQELRETPIYNSVIEAVALGSTRLNEISQKSLLENNSKTSVYLKNLMELGLVEKEFSVDAKIKEKANANRGIYRLADSFFRFWYSFGFPNISELEDGDVDGVYEYVVKPRLHEFAALPFENVCKAFVKELQKDRALPFRYAKLGRWFGKTTVRRPQAKNGVAVAETQIDLLALSKEADRALIGECKFKGRPFSYSEYLDLCAKLGPLKETADVTYALFSESGFDEAITEAAKTTSLLLFSLDEIVQYRSL